MTNCLRCLSPRTLIWCGLVLVYFVLYPGDLSALLAPVESLSVVARRLLEITTAISPWLYVFASVCVVAWTAVCVTERIVGKNRPPA